MIPWLLDQQDPERRDNSYDAANMPNVVINIGGDPFLVVADPAIVQDMLVTKNALIDKTGTWEGFTKNLLGNSFVFSKSDAIWKSKRQATSHAFYKERLAHMLNTLKEKIFETQRKWLE